MRLAVLITVFDRPDYLARTLDSWRAVRGARDWSLRVAVEPSGRQDEVLALLADPLPFGEVETVVNERRLGVAENPYRHLDALVEAGADFVLRAEDDLLVSDDALEVAAFAAAAGAGDPGVAAVCLWSGTGGEADLLERRPEFCPWVWGTWADRWRGTIGPTWDHDYSTWNGSPGFESGWDWNLNTRVLPARGLACLTPALTRVRNIGAVGVHGTADLLPESPGFLEHLAPRAYRVTPALQELPLRTLFSGEIVSEVATAGVGVRPAGPTSRR